MTNEKTHRQLTGVTERLEDVIEAFNEEARARSTTLRSLEDEANQRLRILNKLCEITCLLKECRDGQLANG